MHLRWNIRLCDNLLGDFQRVRGTLPVGFCEKPCSYMLAYALLTYLQRIHTRTHTYLQLHAYNNNKPEVNRNNKEINEINKTYINETIKPQIIIKRLTFACIHPVSITRFPSLRTQPLENLSVDSVTKWTPEQPSPWRNSWERKSWEGVTVTVNDISDRTITLRDYARLY